MSVTGSYTKAESIFLVNMESLQTKYDERVGLNVFTSCRLYFGLLAAIGFSKTKLIYIRELNLGGTSWG